MGAIANNGDRALFSSTDSRSRLLHVLLTALYVAAVIWACGGTKVADEWVHYEQIRRFVHGDFRVFDEYLTTLPTYHYLLAGALKLLGVDSLAAARLLNAILGVAAIVAFATLRRQVHGDSARLATAQMVVLPIVFPFFFLVYTDVLSLALVLAAVSATLASRHGLSVLLLCAAIGTRQNNVIWAGLLAALAAWPTWQAAGTSGWRSMLRLSAPYALPVAAFVAYWYWHGTISYSTVQERNHPDMALHVGNLYFVLILAALLLPLHFVQGLREFAARLRSRPGWLLVPVATMALFVLAYRVDHPFNFIVGDDGYYNVRNRFLLDVEANTVRHLAFGVFATLSLCAWWPLRLKPAAGFWIYPFIGLYLAASWLIEPRYSIIPLCLWLALKPTRSPRVEAVTLMYWACLSLYLLRGMTDGRFFI